MTNAEVPTPETLFGADDDLPTPRCSEWLAAYALGLAHTTSSHHDAVDDLVATAAGSHHLLCEAREHLTRLTHVDHDLLTRTGQLLTAAIAASSPTPVRRSGGADGRAADLHRTTVQPPTDDPARRPQQQCS